MQIAAREIATLPRGGVVPGEWWGFWIEAMNDGISISMQTFTPGGSMYDAYLEYSINGGRTWLPFYESIYDDDYSWSATVTLPKAQDRLFFRAGSAGNLHFSDVYSDACVKFTSNNGYYRVGGNILSLLSQIETTEFPNEMSDWEVPFGPIFQGSHCADISDLELTPSKLVKNAFSELFDGCSLLSTPPALPWTSLTRGCYRYMFSRCTSLSSAPALPATTLAPSCYTSMFYGCTNLSSITTSHTAWSPSNATHSWVTSVKSTGTFICPAALPQTRGNNYIPNNWTIVTT